jgi:hypothetical protein
MFIFEGGRQELPPFKKVACLISILCFSFLTTRFLTHFLSRVWFNLTQILKRLFVLLYWIVWTKNKIKAYFYPEWEFFIFHKDPMIKLTQKRTAHTRAHSLKSTPHTQRDTFFSKVKRLFFRVSHLWNRHTVPYITERHHRHHTSHTTHHTPHITPLTKREIAQIHKIN